MAKKPKRKTHKLEARSITVRSIFIGRPAVISKPPVYTAPVGTLIDRPTGLDYTPEWVPAYNPATDVPADAIDYNPGTHATFQAFIAACNAADKPGKISKAVVDALPDDEIKVASHAASYLYRGLYGYGFTGTDYPTLTYTGPAVGSNTPALLYVWRQTPVIRGLRFKKFGTVLGMAIPSVERRPADFPSDGTFATRANWLSADTAERPLTYATGVRYQMLSTSSHGFVRGVPTGVTAGSNTGVGLSIDTSFHPISLPSADGGAALRPNRAYTGPGLDVGYCEFVDGETAIKIVGDSIAIGKISLFKNRCDGNWGLIDVDAPLWSEVDAAGNEWTGCLNHGGARGDRRLPNIKGNMLHTFIRIGAERGFRDMLVRYQKAWIENNYGWNIQDKHEQLDVSAACFIDVRHGRALVNGDISISFNKIVDVYGITGQEDANGIYFKGHGAVIEGNEGENTGAADARAIYGPDEKYDGCEAAWILCKNSAWMYDPLWGTKVEVKGNTARRMPNEVAVTKVDGVYNVVYEGNEVYGHVISGTTSSKGTVRFYDRFDDGVVIRDNRFIDCVAPYLINLHSPVLPADGTKIEISNNKASRTGGLFYTADQTLIRVDDLPYRSNHKSGFNVLDSNPSDFEMLMTWGPTTNSALPYTYERPKVFIGGAAGSPPVTQVPVSISGTAQVGATLTITPGTYLNGVTSRSYQILRNSVVIGTQTGLTYTQIPADEGASLTVIETATNANGSATSTSNSLGPVAPADTVAYRYASQRYIVPSDTTTLSFPIAEGRYLMKSPKGGIINPKIVMAYFGVQNPSHPNGEIDPPSGIVVEAAIEYSGTTTRLTFGGLNSTTIAAGQTEVVSDAVTLSIPQNVDYYVRFRAAATAGTVLWRRGQANGSSSAQMVAHSDTGTNQVMGTGSLATPSGGSGSASTGLHFPGIISAGTHKAVAIYGDSIAEGTNNDNPPEANTGAIGFLTRGLTSVNGFRVPWVNLARGGERAQTLATDNGKRIPLCAYASHIIVQHGSNDIAASRTLAQLQADYETIIDALRAENSGAEIWSVLLLPRVSGTYLTLAGQTPVAGFEASGIRDQFNTWLIAQTGSLIDGVIDVNSHGALPGLADPTDPNKWAVDVQLTVDGTHPNTTAHIRAAAKVNAWAVARGLA